MLIQGSELGHPDPKRALMGVDDGSVCDSLDSLGHRHRCNYIRGQ